ncbi:MAG: hypothetical protein ACK5IQ_03275 [Bacteroidales bacterium]
MKRKSKIDSLPLGVFLGLLLPLVIFFILKNYQFPDRSVEDLISNVVFRAIFYRMSSLSMIPSLVLFFVAIKTQKDNLSRGLLFSTILLVAITVCVFAFN